MAKRSRTAAERAEQADSLRTRPARALLLAGARELATAQGYESIKAGDIAQAAGVSRETFYTHFADKRSCLAEATDPRLGEVESKLRIAAEEGESWAAPILKSLEAALHDRYGSNSTSRGRIIEAMLALVAEQGYSSIRLADVVKAARVSYPSFYRHFAGKEQCFAAACESLLAQLAVGLERSPASEADQPARLLALAELLAAAPQAARILALEAEQLPRQAEGAAAHASGSRLAELLADAPRGTPQALQAGAFLELLRKAVLSGTLERLPAELAALTPQLAGDAAQERRDLPSAGPARRSRAPRPRTQRGRSRRPAASTSAAGAAR